MQIAWFTVISTLYLLFLAAVDGLFNRLIFRENSDKPYESKEKQAIYELPQWRYIGLIFLLILPILLPLSVSYLIGGLRYVLIYTIILLSVQWDMIFGKLVFNNWWGDTPSISLPYLGWLSFPLRLTILVRLCLAVALSLLLLSI